MKRILFILVMTLMCARISAQTQGRQSFEARLVGKTVTLKVPLYSVLYAPTETVPLAALRDGRVLTGTRELSAKQDGINTLAPEVPSLYFRQIDFSNGMHEVLDTDINRFLEKLNAVRAGISPARLMTYRPGERLVITSVEWNRRLIHIKLGDPSSSLPSATTQTPVSATTISILWPSDLSAEFSEDQRVTDMLTSIFAIE